MAEIALRQIRAIIAVCEEGSFTRAAVRENATQSGISQHVAAAERTLGVKLFERSATGVTPTPAGQRYYKRCVEAVGQLASAADEVRGFAARVSGDLRIGLIPTLTRAALAPALGRFQIAPPRRAAAHRRGLQRLAHGHGACGRARFRRGAGLRKPRRPEVTADRARPRDAGVESRISASPTCSRCGCGIADRSRSSCRAAPMSAAATSRSISRPTASRSPT